MSWRLNAGNETEVMDARGRNVARAHCGGSYGVNWREAEAHARLIAAAPDMLAALELAWPLVVKAQTKGTYEACKAISAAIAKAKGEA
jgi:hypothetical protein